MRREGNNIGIQLNTNLAELIAKHNALESERKGRQKKNPKKVFKEDEERGASDLTPSESDSDKTPLSASKLQSEVTPNEGSDTSGVSIQMVEKKEFVRGQQPLRE